MVNSNAVACCICGFFNELLLVMGIVLPHYPSIRAAAAPDCGLFTGECTCTQKIK